MKRVPRTPNAALVLGGASAPCHAFSPADWIAPPPSLLLAAVWLLVIGWAFHALLRYHLRFDDRIIEAQAQLGVERHARALAERAMADSHKVLCRLAAQQEDVRETERRRMGTFAIDGPPGGGCQLSLEVPLTQPFALH